MLCCFNWLPGVCFFFPIDVSLFREKESKCGQSLYLQPTFSSRKHLFLFFVPLVQRNTAIRLKNLSERVWVLLSFTKRTIAFPQQLTEISDLLNMIGEFCVNYSSKLLDRI